MAEIWKDERILTIDMLGDEFIETVQTGDPVAIHEDGTVEVGRPVKEEPMSEHDVFGPLEFALLATPSSPQRWRRRTPTAAADTPGQAKHPTGD